MALKISKIGDVTDCYKDNMIDDESVINYINSLDLGSKIGKKLEVRLLKKCSPTLEGPLCIKSDPFYRITFEFLDAVLYYGVLELCDDGGLGSITELGVLYCAPGATIYKDLLINKSVELEEGHTKFGIRIC